MLQQTQVKTVLPYFKKFITRFPDIRSLASASEAEVLAYWSGLGYYTRARNIHRAAAIILKCHGGEFPSAMEKICELPGIGRYTAGAIHSIAFNQPQPIVDGNVRRVISRLHGIEKKITESFYWDQAEAWTPGACPSDFNQAVMELGALVCTPADPRCTACPVGALCCALKQGRQHCIPTARSMRRIESLMLVMLVLEHEDSVLLTRRLPAPFIPGPWGLPARVLKSGEAGKAARAIARSYGLKALALYAEAPVRHSITHRRILAHVYSAAVARMPELDEQAGYKWVRFKNLNSHLTSSLFRKALRLKGPDW